MATRGERRGKHWRANDRMAQPLCRITRRVEFAFTFESRRRALGVARGRRYLVSWSGDSRRRPAAFARTGEATARARPASSYH